MPHSFKRVRDAVQIPAEARAAITTARGERLLTWGRDESSGDLVVASNHRLYAVSSAGQLVLERPWHLVDGGAWEHDTFAITVTWVDGSPPVRWVFHERTLLPETLRERVQASVVLAEVVPLGARRLARCVVRQDLATGELVEQSILGRGVRSTDPGVVEATGEALARLREQVGLS